MVAGGTGVRRMRIVAQSLVAIVSLLVLGAAGYGWSTYRSLANSLTTSTVLGAPTTSGPARTITALLVGIDSRTDAQGNPLPRALLDEMHAGPDEGELNTDTIVLLRIPAEASKPVVAVSLPRDTYVELAGDYGSHKLNSAYGRAVVDAQRSLAAQGYSGPALERASLEAGRRELVATVQQLTGIPIDHFAEINLAGFVELTDAVGGVPVCLNAPVDDSRYSGAVLPAGPQTLRGGDALAFVRQRHGLPDSDLDRIIRQQAYMAGLTHSLIGARTLADPATVDRLLGIVARYVVVDQGWDLDRLVDQIRRVSATDVEFRTIPTIRSDLRTPYDGVAVEVDPAQVRSFVGSVLAGLPVPSTTTPSTTTPTTTATPAPSARAVVGAPSSGAPGGATTTSAPPAQPITAAAVPCVD